MNISSGLIQEGQNGVMEVVESVKDVLSNEVNIFRIFCNNICVKLKYS